jgi:MMP endo-(1,4)-3-O-methyl-alpha-D-mannosidase
MSRLPHIEDVLTAEDVELTALSIVDLQLDDGMVPWFEGGHCDPWNHVETAMALDVAGFHSNAERAYEWLVDIQRPEGAFHNYYLPGGGIEDSKLDTNVSAYVATGVWHHWLCTWDRGFVDHLWPTVERALDWVLSMRRQDGTILWAREPHEIPWDYALLTGSSSIMHSLESGAKLAALINEPRPDWIETAQSLREIIVDQWETAFEPKTRWAMDWYYPVLSGAMTGEIAKARMNDGWDTFAMEGRGIRCVSDAAWVTASETAECALSFNAMGDPATASDLLSWTRAHRCPDGSYLTGIVYPSLERFPADECSAYTGAAVILAADAITGASGASKLFVPPAPSD